MRTRPRILLFTGDGKGKTTAAAGMLLRAVGHGMPSCLVQFIKDAPSGELVALAQLGVVVMRSGLGFVSPVECQGFSAHRQAAQQALDLAAGAIRSRRFRLVVLDEICTAVALDLLEEEQVLEVVCHAQADLILALTGRGATPGLLAIADTATQMQCLKHGMSQGIMAQKGVEL